MPAPPEPEAIQQSSPPSEVDTSRKLDQKRKRPQGDESSQEQPLEKRARISPTSCAVEDKQAAEDTDKGRHAIDHWLREGSWPKEFFEPGSQTWEDLQADREADRLAEERQLKEEWYIKQEIKANNMAHPLLARKRSTASLRRQEAAFGTETQSDLPREGKSAKYKNPAYEIELEGKGSFMRESDLGITEESKALCRDLLNSAQTVAQDSLFRDDRFATTCRKLHNENEAMILQDITRLIVPSAKNLATCGATSLEHLVESVNRGWNSAIPVTTPRPQPDYSVGFGQSAFTDDQLEKLKPFVGDLLLQPTDFSYFMATWKMYFPFLTCEVKCGASALDVADRQNAHSMTHAVRAVVELYKHARWEEGFDWKEAVHRNILAFSISHDDRTVRIYGHYPVIENDRTTFYRHSIREFILTDLDGRDKWTAYKFVKNVYELWMPDHLKRITKAIDALPVGLDVSAAAFTSHPSMDNESELPSSQEMVETAPSSQDTERSKKQRLKPTAMLQQEIDWLKQQLTQEREESKQQLAREKEESKQRHTELMEQNKKLIDMLSKG